MSSAKEIKSRINSVRETRKITNAMYLIASTKLRRAKRELELTKPYFTAMKSEIKRIFRTAADISSRYFYPDEHKKPLDGTFAYLVITADKGLAGAYNHDVLKEAMRLLSNHPDAKLFVVGEYGRQFFLSHNVPLEKEFLYTAQNPTFHRAREIGGHLLDLYNSGEVVKLFVIYTDYGINPQVNSTRLLPFHKSQFGIPAGEKAVHAPFEFCPSVENVLENAVPSYVEGFIFSALIDSFCCEQSARMTAMDAANRNADKLLQEMNLLYNHIRQGAITQEITEISAGAKHQKRKKLTAVKESEYHKNR